jgi:hypothetical protein
MAKNLFSVPIFFIVFRETLEAAIIVSVLLGLVEQLVAKEGQETPVATSVAGNEGSDTDSKNGSGSRTRSASGLVEDDTIQRRRLLRRMRIQVGLRGSKSNCYIHRTLDFPWVRHRVAHCSLHWRCVCPNFGFVLGVSPHH